MKNMRDKQKHQRGHLGLYIAGIIVIVGALIGGVISCIKLEKIDPGHVGVSVKKCGGGGVSPDPIPTGYYWRKLFCEDVIMYPTSMQSLVLMRMPKEDDSITVTSSEGLSINLDIALNFTLDPKMVPQIYVRWRAKIEDISHKFIRQTIREALQLTFAKYTAEQLYSDKKEIARMEGEKLIVEKLGPMGFVIVQFTINRVEPPKQVIEAINAKVAMVQEAQRSEQEVRKKQAEAAQKVAVTTGEADAARVQAEGQAAAILTVAEAQAKANKVLAESVTPALIQYEQARRWDGKLPQVTGAGAPMPIIQPR